MFWQKALKWLIIVIIVLSFFLVVLLSLGYLLKENAVSTTQLKAELEQAAVQQQAKEQRQKQRFDYKPVERSASEKSQQKIIDEHQTCETDKQCFLLHTNSEALGCIVVVNTKGAAILLKVASQQEEPSSKSNACQQVYVEKSALTAQCVNQACSF